MTMNRKVIGRPTRVLSVESEQGTVLVNRIWTHKGLAFRESSETEQIRVPLFRTTPAKVRVTGSVTRNLGNYNSCRIEISVELPCYPEESELDRAYAYASAYIDRHMETELAKIEDAS